MIRIDQTLKTIRRGKSGTTMSHYESHKITTVYLLWVIPIAKFSKLLSSN